MTRIEIKNALKSQGKFDSNSKDPLWMDAFNLYYQETRQKLSLSCGSCWTKIREWLNRP
jgi:hypothetical protein